VYTAARIGGVKPGTLLSLGSAGNRLSHAALGGTGLPDRNHGSPRLAYGLAPQPGCANAIGPRHPFNYLGGG